MSAVAAGLTGLGTRELHRRYRSGELRPSEVVEAHVRRVLALDLRTEGAPPVNCVLSLSDDARREADAMDRALAAGGVAGGLFGVPVWIKDNVDVRGLPTTCGCLALEDNVAERDAALVAGLRRAGAVVMGKVGMTELGNGTSPFSTMSCRIGNAHDPRNPPGGSSGGSAVAVAMGFGVLAVGVDDLGSITEPAALNGCVGLRPTVGLVSRDGVVPFAATDTSPGPIARTVYDAAAMLDALRTDGGGAAIAVADAIDADTLEGVRIGVIASVGGRAFSGTGPPVEGVTEIERILAALRDAGAEIVSDVRMDAFRLRRRTRTSYHNALTAALRGRSSPPRSVYELATGGRVAPHHQRNAGTWKMRLARPLLSRRMPDVHARLQRRTIRHNRTLLAALLAEHRLDCVAALTNALPAMIATLAQAPHLTIPAGSAAVHRDASGFVPGEIPVGVSLVGAPGDDHRLLRLGALIERRTPLSRPPGPGTGSVPPGIDLDAFRRIKRRIAHGSLDLLQPGASGYERPSADEFRDFVDDLLTQESSTRRGRAARAAPAADTSTSPEPDHDD